MKKILSKNIVCIITSLLILFSGSVSYSLLHFSCISDGNIHTDCIEDCCQAVECCENDENVFTDQNTKLCCEIHKENTNQINTFLPIIKVSKVKIAFINYSYKTIERIESYRIDRNYDEYPVLTDICILQSTLRI